MAFQVGQLIKGRYRLTRRIGDGGMGAVFEARHQLLGTTTALKFLHPHLVRQGNCAERFLQEAQVSARIQNPHVVRATDVDRTEDGTPYMVMDFVDGDTLFDHYEKLREEGSWLERETAFDYILQICEGVEAAHALGAVHRDLKPDNVMREPREEEEGMLLRILDFGVAKLKVSDEVAALTAPGMVVGTPEYMAPEQALKAAAVDLRADIFSLGVMFYEMLSGTLPATGPLVAIVDVFLSGSFPPLDELASVDSELAAAVHRAMAPKPEDRYPSVAAFREAIGSFASSGTLAALPHTVSRPPAPPAAPPDEPPAVEHEAHVGAETLEEAPTSESLRASIPAEEPPPAAPIPQLNPQPTPQPVAPDVVAQPKKRGVVWLVLAALIVFGGVTTVGFVYRDSLEDALFGSTTKKKKRKKKRAKPKPVAPSAEPSASASAVPAPEASRHELTGSWGKRSVVVRYVAERDSRGRADIEVAVREKGKPLKLTSLRAVLQHHDDHRKRVYPRKRISGDAHRFQVAVYRNGNYHLTITSGTRGGPEIFHCEVCLGDDKTCARRDTKCRRGPAPQGHRR